jgi:F420 biosynthesis protein FbiB-like protein
MSGANATQSLHDFLRSRRSVRRFAARPVGEDILRRLLESATRAPNAHNRQPWRFVHLKSAASREQLAAAMAPDFRAALESEGLDREAIEAQLARSRDRITEAPEAILLCLDRSVLDTYADENRSRGEHLMAVQSVALAGGQLLLAAHAEGLGGVWVCAPLFVPDEVRQALALDESWEAQGLLLLGYSAKDVEARPRRDLEDIYLER